MRIEVSKQDGCISEITSPDLQFHIKEEGVLFLWGKVHLFKNMAFKKCPPQLIELFNFEELIPLLTGSYISAIIKDGKLIKIAVDFYGHKQAFVQEKKNHYIFTDQIQLLKFDETFELDKFQIRHFVDKGFTWGSGTFINQLKKISSTQYYSFADGKFKEDFLPFPTFVREGTLEEAMSSTLKALEENNEKIALSFSSGIDSSYIREIAYRSDIKITPFLGYYNIPRFSYCEEDYDLSMRLSEGRNDIHVCKIENAYKQFASTIKKTIELLPFDFHPSIIQSSICHQIKNEGFTFLVTGQNSDAIYNLSATHGVPLSKTIKRLLSLRLHHSGLKGHYKRYLQTGGFLRRLQKGHPPYWSKFLWNKVNPGYDFTIENILMAYLKENEEMPTICHNKNDIYEIEYIKQYKDFIDKLSVLLERGESPRMMMIRGKMIGYCQGRDVRTFTEWANEYGLYNMQLFTSGPVLSWLGTHNLNSRDIFVGKRGLRNYLEKTIRYSRFKKQVPNYACRADLITSETELFEKLYLNINKDGWMDNKCNDICKLLYNQRIISDKELDAITSNKYSDCKFRLFWLAQSLSNILEY